MSRMEPGGPIDARVEAASWAATTLALATSLALIWHAAGAIGATYDEVTYLEVASRWWRTGEQESIARMGSPLTFWKLQQAPALAWLDGTDRGAWIDDPVPARPRMLPVVRRGAAWIWAVALLTTAIWAGLAYGPAARASAAWLFALGPNLLAHGTLITMETPVTACAALACLGLWLWLDRGSRLGWWLSAVAAGVGFSCKFTILALVPLFGLAHAWVLCRGRGMRFPSALARVAATGAAYLAVMAATDLAITGGAAIPLSESRGEHPALSARLGPALGQTLGPMLERPWAQDLVAFARQMQHQASGGPSYLFGERRMRGWLHYYLVALAVKLPVGAGLLLAARLALRRRVATGRSADFLMAIIPIGLLALASMGSSRNYGVRYLLPAAPAAIVWGTAIVRAGPLGRVVMAASVVLVALATASVHPHELTFFNRIAGGQRGGRLILADSNLDWGQGAPLLARLQRERPELRDLTLFYFGQGDPGDYGVVGRRIVIDAGTRHPSLPEQFRADSAYVAVSSSLVWGPWGPAGYFDRLRGIAPVAWTADGTIAIYRMADVPST